MPSNTIKQSTSSSSPLPKPTSPDEDAPNPGVNTAPMSQASLLTDGIDAGGATGNQSVEQAMMPLNRERPRNWITGVSSTLTNLVTEAKGIASKPVVSFIEKHLKGTKLIFVVGQSGTGKSTFIKEISGMDIHIGKTRKSGTTNHQVCPAIVDDEQYIFIDTPGFGAADIPDMDCFCDIIACLDALGPFVTVAGLIYVTGGNQERLTQQELKTIQWIKCFCGPQFYRHITIMTSKWDRMSEDDFEEGFESMLSLLKDDPEISEIINPSADSNNSEPCQGGSIYHHGLVVDDGHPNMILNRLTMRRHPKERADMARAMIKSRFNQAPGVKLQVIREMNKKIRWDNTEAAKILNNEPRDVELRFQDGMLRVFVKGKAYNIPNGKEFSAVQMVSKQQPKAEEQHQTWYSKIFYWLGVAKEVATFFMGLS
ncbi:P-loop containing nucleoside triphosphate hydrolase protein [Xylaria grammica]|nr:P-loop containing nucleoside triphosphate hydrolase protein [Xylaria grammica]